MNKERDHKCTEPTNYQAIAEQSELLDSMMHYARYATGAEESVWVCETCEQVDVDPYEQNCSCYEIGDTDVDN